MKIKLNKTEMEELRKLQEKHTNSMKSKTLIVCLDTPSRLICSDIFELKELVKPEVLEDMISWAQIEDYTKKPMKIVWAKKEFCPCVKGFKELQALKEAIEKVKK